MNKKEQAFKLDDKDLGIILRFIEHINATENRGATDPEMEILYNWIVDTKLNSGIYHLLRDGQMLVALKGKECAFWVSDKAKVKQPPLP
jgi:hypothetical protein